MASAIALRLLDVIIYSMYASVMAHWKAEVCSAYKDLLQQPLNGSAQDLTTVKKDCGTSGISLMSVVQFFPMQFVELVIQFLVVCHVLSFSFPAKAIF